MLEQVRFQPTSGDVSELSSHARISVPDCRICHLNEFIEVVAARSVILIKRKFMLHRISFAMQPTVLLLQQ